MRAPNIGPTILSRLRVVGVRTVEDIERVGAGAIYRALSAREPERRLPVCYYLYSLQGAVERRDWRRFSQREKRALRLSAGLR